jgi:hypothetical protein
MIINKYTSLYFFKTLAMLSVPTLLWTGRLGNEEREEREARRVFWQEEVVREPSSVYPASSLLPVLRYSGAVSGGFRNHCLLLNCHFSTESPPLSHNPSHFFHCRLQSSAKVSLHFPLYFLQVVCLVSDLSHHQPSSCFVNTLIHPTLTLIF